MGWEDWPGTAEGPYTSGPNRRPMGIEEWGFIVIPLVTFFSCAYLGLDSKDLEIKRVSFIMLCMTSFGLLFTLAVGIHRLIRIIRRKKTKGSD